FEVADSGQVPWLSCRLEEWVRRFGASLPMRMTASWFRSLDLPHTRLWRDSTAPESGLPSDCHPDCIIVLEAVRMRPGEIEPRTRRWKKCVTLLDSKSPIQADIGRIEIPHRSNLPAVQATTSTRRFRARRGVFLEMSHWKCTISSII